MAACNQRLAVAPFSSAERDGIGAVDLTAPGVNIYSSAPGGRFDNYAGTSMATSHVAGLAALLARSEPRMTASELWDRLKVTARRLDPAEDFGAGLTSMPDKEPGAVS